jgi:hypothetical protein
MFSFAPVMHNVLMAAADEEDYFSKEDDDEDDGGGSASVSGRVGNGVAHPMGSVTGTFSLRSLVDYDDEDDEDTADGDKGARLCSHSKAKFYIL